jgi:hypothetical protein
MYYKTSNFDFSAAARSWILNEFGRKFETHFLHDLDVEQFSPEWQNRWHASPAGREIVDFLRSQHLDTGLYGIGAFICNTTERYIGNPHVDNGYSIDMKPFRIKSRLNVMVLGDYRDEMVWWPDWIYGDSRLVTLPFTDSQGNSYQGSAVPGNDPRERWAYLGEPGVRARNILTPSAFVKTDCAHTVVVNPGPRLIITVALDRDLKDL